VNRKLEQAGVPTLLLEVEQHQPVPAQFRTRVEAFVEVLRGKKAS
jgi:benzoyl-CoA reductase/2-hydroxyglutaryl-CoA dehydratase subunit BcrC/BadD/HgdB